MNRIVTTLIIYTFYVIEANALDTEERNLIEARGKGKYALLTHLAFVLAAKVGLYKIFLGIALVVAAVKAMVVMAWALAVARYVPDVWPNHRNDKFPNYHHLHHSPVPQTPSNLFMDMFLSSFNLHFFYVAATKLFVLKIVYGIIFYIIVTKAWHLVLWLIHYMKEKKHHHHVKLDHVYDHHHDHGLDYGHHPHFPHDHGSDYGHNPYGAYDSPGFDLDYSPSKKIYDADGSYSVG